MLSNHVILSATSMVWSETPAILDPFSTRTAGSEGTGSIVNREKNHPIPPSTSNDRQNNCNFQNISGLSGLREIDIQPATIHAIIHLCVPFRYLMWPTNDTALPISSHRCNAVPLLNMSMFYIVYWFAWMSKRYWIQIKYTDGKKVQHRKGEGITNKTTLCIYLAVERKEKAETKRVKGAVE